MNSSAFAADMARFDKAFRDAGAVLMDNEGFAYIDESKLPKALVSAYRRLLSFGYANGLLP